MDRDPKHMNKILKRAHKHRGASFIEIYQNCNIFNDGAFFDFTEKDTKDQRVLFLEHNKPLVFDNGKKGVRLDGFKPQVVDLEDGSYSIDDCIVHDETSQELAQILSRMFWQPGMPRPFGVFYQEKRPTYDQMLVEQIEMVQAKRGTGNLDKLIAGYETWEIN
jgi:2-oxoglutarate ferredoxin oxidoreductase subunit beta